MRFCRTVLALLASLAMQQASFAGQEQAPADTEWDLGLGVAGFSYYLYPGAANTNSFLLPAPYFTYRSPEFEIDRGIKSFIYNSETIVIDISADFNLPVKSSETVARQGMPDLDFMLQLGPSIEFLLNDARESYFDARFELPVRLALTTDFSSVDTIGFVLEPRFSFAHRRQGKHGIDHKLTVGLRFATDEFLAYYYDVEQVYATADRARYQTAAGFAGSLLKYRISYRDNDLVYYLFARYQSLRGAVFEDSPLVVKQDYGFFGLGFAWVFASNL